MRQRGYAIASLFCLVAPGLVLAQDRPKCFFLECSSRQSAEQPPAPAPTQQSSLAPMPVQPSPQPQALRRPSAAGQTCIQHGGFEYCASSVLKPQIDNAGRTATYGPEQMLDGKLDTAWVEGKGGQGEGEWVVVDFGGARRISALQIYNGYHKNVDLFKKNSRVRDVEIVFSDGRSQIATLADRDGPQTINGDGNVSAAWMQIKIRSVYAGTRYQDTAITELRVIAAR